MTPIAHISIGVLYIKFFRTSGAKHISGINNQQLSLSSTQITHQCFILTMFD